MPSNKNGTNGLFKTIGSWYGKLDRGTKGAAQRMIPVERAGVYECKYAEYPLKCGKSAEPVEEGLYVAPSRGVTQRCHPNGSESAHRGLPL